MSALFSMSGHGAFIWGAYGVTALLVIVEIIALRARRKVAIEAALASSADPQPPAVLGTSRAR